MLDLIDIAKRVGPEFPARVVSCDLSDRKLLFTLAEWDDDMTYLMVDYNLYYKYVGTTSLVLVGATNSTGGYDLQLQRILP